MRTIEDKTEKAMSFPKLMGISAGIVFGTIYLMSSLLFYGETRKGLLKKELREGKQVVSEYISRERQMKSVIQQSYPKPFVNFFNALFRSDLEEKAFNDYLAGKENHSN
jgi:hypothetical protein